MKTQYLLFPFLFFLLSCNPESTNPVDPVLLPAAKNVVLEDRGDQGNSSDLIVSFNYEYSLDTINGLDELRIILLKEASLEGFDLEAARETEFFQSISNDNPITGNQKLSIVLGESMKDNFGNEVVRNELYVCVIFSKSKNNERFLEVISEPSNKMELL